jgi:hypothetical protein
MGEPRPVLDAVDALHAQGEDDVHRIARLDQGEDRRDRDGRHQAAREALARHGAYVIVGRFGKLPCVPSAKVSFTELSRRAEVDVAAQLVLADDRGDVEEDRSVRVAHLDQVQEHHLLPGRGDRFRVVEAVVGTVPAPRPLQLARSRDKQARKRMQGFISRWLVIAPLE